MMPYIPSPVYLRNRLPGPRRGASRLILCFAYPWQRLHGSFFGLKMGVWRLTED